MHIYSSGQVFMRVLVLSDSGVFISKLSFDYLEKVIFDRMEHDSD